MVSWSESGWVPLEDMGDPFSLPEHAETQTCHRNPPRGDQVRPWTMEDPGQYTESPINIEVQTALGFFLK